MTFLGSGGGSAPDWILKQVGALPSPPDDADDHFEVGTALDTAGARRAGATPWVKTNWGATTDDIVDGVLRIIAPGSGSTNIRLAEQVLSGATWKYRARIAGLAADSNYAAFGMHVRDSGSGRFISIHSVYAANNLESNRWNSVTSYNSSSSTQTLSNRFVALSWRWFEVSFDGTNLSFGYSPSGMPNSFVAMRTETPASFLANPSHVGLMVHSENNQPVHCYCDVFLKVA